MSAAPPPVIQTERAAFESPGLSKAKDVTLTVTAGEMIVVTGPEGSGKSTLLRGLLGLATHTAGSASLFGSPLAELAGEGWTAARTRCAYASWTAPLLANLTLFDNLAVPLFMRSVSQSNAQADVERMLDRFGLFDLQGKRPPELLGDKHRLAILARALVVPAELLLIDDPPPGEAVDAALNDALELGQTVLLSSKNPARFPQARHVAL